MDKVSIIIPVYNSEKFLPRCLESIINQTYKNLEIIIVDDGSTDNSRKIISDYIQKDTRINLISKKNSGVSASRNIGLEKATGNYVIFIDSDDWIELKTIEKMHDIIVKENVDVVRANYKIVNNLKTIKKGTTDNLMNQKITNPKSLIEKFLLPPKALPCYSVLLMFNKKIEIKYNEKIGFMEDTLFYIDILSKIDSIYLMKEELYNYYYNEQSKVNNKENYLNNIQQLLEVNQIIKKKNPNISKKLNAKHLTIILGYLRRTINRDEEYKKICDFLNSNNIFNNMIKYYDDSLCNIKTKFQLRLLRLKAYKILKIFWSIIE